MGLFGLVWANRTSWCFWLFIAFEYRFVYIKVDSYVDILLKYTLQLKLYLVSFHQLICAGPNELTAGLIWYDFGHISLALQYQLLKFLLLVGSILGIKLFWLGSFLVDQKKYRSYANNWQLLISRDIENSRFRDMYLISKFQFWRNLEKSQDFLRTVRREMGKCFKILRSQDCLSWNFFELIDNSALHPLMKYNSDVTLTPTDGRFCWILNQL